MYGNRKCETKGRSRHQNNNKRGARNLEERYLGMKREIAKQGLTRDDVLSLILPEEYIRL